MSLHSPPPGRLRVTERLDRVQVELPVDLLLPRILWGAITAFGVIGAMTSAEGAGMALGALLSLVILGGIGWLLGRAIQAMRHRQRAVGVLLLGTMIGTFTLLLSAGTVALWPSLGMAVCCALFYFLPMVWMARSAPTLLLEQGTLAVQSGRTVRHIPLESLKPEADLPLRGLTSPERQWLLALLAAEVARRQAVLTAEGHDLAEPARPPPALEVLRQG